MTSASPPKQAPTSANTTTNNDQLMTLERLLQVDEELTNMLQRKKELERNLTALETQIYNVEGRYLETTALSGNVSRGFATYMLPPQQQRSVNLFAGQTAPVVSENDRIFSQSSLSYRKARSNYVFVYGQALSMIKDLEMASAPYKKKKTKIKISLSGATPQVKVVDESD